MEEGGGGEGSPEEVAGADGVLGGGAAHMAARHANLAALRRGRGEADGGKWPGGG